MIEKMPEEQTRSGGATSIKNFVVEKGNLDWLNTAPPERKTLMNYEIIKMMLLWNMKNIDDS